MLRAFSYHILLELGAVFQKLSVYLVPPPIRWRGLSPPDGGDMP